MSHSSMEEKEDGGRGNKILFNIMIESQADSALTLFNIISCPSEMRSDSEHMAWSGRYERLL